MRRFGIGVSTAVLAASIAGCGGGGIPEGQPVDAAKANPQPPGFEDMMKKMGDQMKNTKAQKKAPVVAKKAEEAPAPAPEK